MIDFFFPKKPLPLKKQTEQTKKADINFFFLKSNNYNTLERVMEEAFHAVNKNSK